MARRTKTDETKRRALDLWQPPADAGEPLVCLATTFTFDAAFFETECLGRFLRMETHPTASDSVGYLIEREEKLAGAHVAVLADRRHATEKESARWDVLPVIVPHATLHAKLALLCWADVVRVIVSSANLTEIAYRKNVEVCGTLEARRDEGGPMGAIRECMDFLTQVLNRVIGREGQPGPLSRSREALATARKRIRGWAETSGPGDRRDAVPVFGGLGKPVLDQVQERWLRTKPTRWVRVAAPFYEPAPGDREVARALLEPLAKRGERNVIFDVHCEEQPDGRLRVFASKGMVEEAAKTCDVEVNRIEDAPDGEPRPLHAKQFWFENDTDAVLMIGSSNATIAGLGLHRSHANLEANLVYRARQRDSHWAALEQTWVDIEDELDPTRTDLIWLPAAADEGEGEGTPLLPAAFEEALYRAGETPILRIALGEGLPADWTITGPEGAPVLCSSDAGAGPGERVVDWKSRPIPAVLDVNWTGSDGQRHAAGWPVNVEDLAVLPPPDALRGLTLEELLQVLGSNRPLFEAVRDAKVRKGKSGGCVDPELDPLKRVNTEAYLLRRTKRAALALDRLRERLERPVVTKEALDWRLSGPVGADALANAFVGACQPGEAAFFLAELVLTLKRVDAARAAAGGLDSRVIREALDGCIERTRSVAAPLQVEAAPGMAAYIDAAFSEARK